MRSQLFQYSQQPGIQLGRELLPEPRSPPTAGQGVVAILSHLAVAAIGQATNLAFEELAAARDFAPALLCLGGNADGGQFIGVTVQVAGQTQAKRPGIEFVGFTFAVQY